MNNPNVISSPTVTILGGGSAGQNAAEYLNAIEANRVEGVTSAKVNVVVTVGDNGGGTGGLRDIYGGNANGDARRSISDLSENSYARHNFEDRVGQTDTAEEAQTVFDTLAERLETSLSYSDSTVDPERQTEIINNARSLSAEIYQRSPDVHAKLALGHLVIQAIENETGDFQGALDEAGQLMRARGQVIAVSTVPHHVVMRDGDKIIYGEHTIDEHTIQNPDDVQVALAPVDPSQRVTLSPRAKAAIEASDTVAVSPGSVYTSIVPVLLPEGMPEALATVKDRGGELAIITNLVTQPKETDGWSAGRYVKTAEKYAETPFDVVIVNENIDVLPANEAVLYDREEFEQQAGHLRVHSTDLVKREVKTYDPKNPVKDRSEVSHDMGAAAAALTSGIRQAPSRQLVAA